MKSFRKILASLACSVLLTATAFSQSGGPYVITQSVIANGGGVSSDAEYSITGTAGQHSAGVVSNAVPYRMYGGFWTPDVLAPTAANVSISGRVTTPEGYGLSKAIVVVTLQDGSTRAARTNPFGNYEIDGIEAGQTVIVTVSSKLFQFATQVVNLTDNVLVDFTATAAGR